jgi:hypothetical protein
LLKIYKNIYNSINMLLQLVGLSEMYGQRITPSLIVVMEDPVF